MLKHEKLNSNIDIFLQINEVLRIDLPNQEKTQASEAPIKGKSHI